MEVTTGLKTAGLSLGGAGVAGATGYGVYKFMQPTTIREKLVWEKLKLMDTDKADIEPWKKLAKQYPTKDSENKAFPDLSSLASGTDDAKGTELKKKCEEVLKEELTHTDADNAKLAAARAWCTETPTTPTV